MTSAKIINFPRTRRRRHVPPAPVRYAGRPSSRGNGGGFGLLFFLTIVAAFAYLSGAGNVARHDTAYAVLLAVVWSIYCIHPLLLRTRIAPLLIGAGRLLLLAGAAGFFGFLYWIVLTHP